MNVVEMVEAVQSELGITADGKAGPETWLAIHKRICGRTPVATNRAGIDQPVDPRSERVIGTLQREIRPYARALLHKAAATGITIKVISGLRTYAEQNALYAQGRSKPGRIVTNARGGYSNHNFGIAFDVGVFDGSKYVPESPRYKAVGAIGMDLGLEWGGNWRTLQDEPHFQLRPPWAIALTEREMLAGLRARKESGKALYV